MKLELGKTYLTPSGEQIKITHVQSLLFGAFKLYRQHEGSSDHWFESGGHSSGNDALKLIMEMPEHEKTVETTRPVGTTPINSALGVLRIEIDWDARQVRSVTVE